MSLVRFRPEAPFADLAHLVERDLAKVEVAGSSPVIRSNKKAAPPLVGGAAFLLSRLAVASNRAELEEVRRRVKFADLQGKWSRLGDKAKLHYSPKANYTSTRNPFLHPLVGGAAFLLHIKCNFALLFSFLLGKS